MISFKEVDKLFKQKKKKSNLPVYLVGYEKDHVYLIARDDLYEKKTCIEMVDVLNKDRKILYVDENNIKCVSASLNAEKSVLAYTTHRRKSHEDVDGIYESFFVDLGEEKARYLFNVRGNKFQCIQFISGYNKNPHFLFFKDKERIEMYTISIGKKDKGIESQPERQATFVTKYLWSQWDPQHSLLYYLEKEKNGQYVLRCCSFINRPTVLFERDFLQLNLPTDPPMYDKFPWKNGHCAPDSSIYFQVVRTPHPILCQQVLHSEMTDGIHVCLYVIHHNVKLNIKIPVKEKSLVFFGTIAGFVVIMIPGKFVQFIDVDKDHYPRELLTWTEDDVVGLPGQKSEPYLLLIDSKSDNGHMMDLRKGTLYDYDLDREYLMKWMVREQSPEKFTKILHLSISHLKDEEFTEKIIFSMIKNMHQNITHEVFSEYLLASSFVKLKHLDDDFLRMIPMSMEENKTGLETIKLIGESHIHESHLPRIVPKVTILDKIKSSINYQKEYYYKVEEKRPSGLSGFFSFPWSPSKQIIMKADNTKIFSDAFQEHLAVKKFDPIKVARWAQEYSVVAHDLAQYLYKLCKDSNESRSYFLLLEKFYCALEETAFPPPQGFFEHFTMMGYRILPKKAFIQYIQRNVFSITENLVEVLIKEKKLDPPYIYFILRRLEDKNKEILYHEKLCTEQPYLIQYYHSILPKQQNPSELMNAYNRSMEQKSSNDGPLAFAPLKFYFLSLEENYRKREYEFIKNRSITQFKNESQEIVQEDIKEDTK